jgi:hypothetical protein
MFLLWIDVVAGAFWIQHVPIAREGLGRNDREAGKASLRAFLEDAFVWN